MSERDTGLLLGIPIDRKVCGVTEDTSAINEGCRKECLHAPILIRW
jgi:hypothetical protein